VGHGGAGIFAAIGSGKTAVVLRALLALKDAGLFRRALVVAPPRVMRQVWPREAAEWAGTEWERVKELRVVMLHGEDKDALAMQDADIYVINAEGLKWLFEDGKFKRFRCMVIDTFIVDESTLFKNRNTKRFKMVSKVLPSFQRRWIMTGTPNPNGYMNLFPQIYLIDLGLALGKYVTRFRQEYFVPINDWEWRLQAGADKRIQEKIAPYIFQLDAGDYREIPVEPNVVRVDLPPAARKLYNKMEEEMLVELNNQRFVVAANSGAAHMKCAQIANGGLYHMVGPGGIDFTNLSLGQSSANTFKTLKRTWENLHEAKTDAVEELVEELNGSPALVVYDFLHDLDRLRKRFPRAPFIGGGVSLKESERLCDAWNRDEFPVMLVQATSVSRGLNLQRGSAQDVIWHSLTFDLEVFQQLNGRLARQGSKHDRIFSHLIVVNGTTDEARLRALRSKDKTQQAFLAALREYAKNRQKGRKTA